jgi:hypothetical protein
MVKVGDQVSVASKSGPRVGVVVSASGSILRIRWDSGDETGLIPGPGTLTVLKTRQQNAGAKKSPDAKSGTGQPEGKAKAKAVPKKKPAPKTG